MKYTISHYKYNSVYFSSKEEAKITILLLILKEIEVKINQNHLYYDKALEILKFIELINDKKYDEALAMNHSLITGVITINTIYSNEESNILNYHFDLILSDSSMKAINSIIKENIFK